MQTFCRTFIGLINPKRRINFECKLCVYPNWITLHYFPHLFRTTSVYTSFTPSYIANETMLGAFDWNCLSDPVSSTMLYSREIISLSRAKL